MIFGECRTEVRYYVSTWKKYWARLCLMLLIWVTAGVVKIRINSGVAIKLRQAGNPIQGK